MKWKRIPLGEMQTNCYLAIQDKECLIIDPGAEPQRLIQIINENKLQPIAVLLTHGHFDHIGAVDAVCNQYQISCYIYQSEAKFLQNPAYNCSAMLMKDLIVEKQTELFEEGLLEIGNFKLEVIHTPGHTAGSVSFYDPVDQIVFAGDTLFCQGIGRTDLPTGNTEKIISSIRNKLFLLPDDTVVLPGHGSESLICIEKTENPYL